MDDFIDVLAADDLSDGGMTVVDVGGHELLVARVGEQVYITDNRCPHLGGRLSKGELSGSIVSCHLHHSQFDLSDGRVIRWTNWKGAALSIAELARHPRPLRTYEVKVEAGRVLVGAEKAPPSDPSEGT